jgi:hypothetical protein
MDFGAEDMVFFRQKMALSILSADLDCGLDCDPSCDCEDLRSRSLLLMPRDVPLLRATLKSIANSANKPQVRNTSMPVSY